MKKIPRTEDIEFGLLAINNPVLMADESFQQWFSDDGNRELFDELLLYREAILKSKNAGAISEENEWKEFIARHNKTEAKPLQLHINASREGTRKARRALLYWASGVAAAIIAVFIIIQTLIVSEHREYIPEFIAQTAPREITVQSDGSLPVPIDIIIDGKTSTQTQKKALDISSIMEAAGIINEPKADKTNSDTETSSTQGKQQADEPGKNTGTTSTNNNREDPVQVTVSSSVQKYTLSIPRGKSFHVILEDKTEVWLNADSRLTYPNRFAADKREVVLSGEAYFKVAEDAGRPFIVKSKYLTGRVLGTEFNMRVYNEDDASVTLVEGSIAVGAEGRGEILLVPGQNGSMLGDGFNISTVDVRNYTAWVDGFFYHDESSLEEIMKDLGRWYNVNIEFVDAKVRNYKFRFWGDKSEPVGQAITTLNQTGKVNIVLHGNKIKIKDK